MKLDIDFINAANIPQKAIEINYDLNGFRYVIKNPVYANIFWLYLWHNRLAGYYAKQKMVVDLENYDLTMPVYFDEDLNLLSAPPTIQAIEYYANLDPLYKPWFLLPFRMTTILFVFIVSFLVVAIFTQVIFKTKRTISNMS